MRDKYDFENLVYEKAGVLSAKEHKYNGYRKAALSTAAVFAVLTVAAGAVFAVGSFSSMGRASDSMGYPVMDNNNTTNKNTTEGVPFNENAAAQTAETYLDDDYEEYDNYANGLNADIYDNGESADIVDSVVYTNHKDNSVLNIHDENVFNDFKNAVENLEETKDLIGSNEEILCEINIIENNGHESDYVTRIAVYGDVLEITYEGEYAYNDNGQYVKVSGSESEPVRTYFISDEFTKLVRENFDEHFMDD